MKKNILLTGKPGCGKTTLIRRVVARYKGPVSGFFTQEIRTHGKREGFLLVTLDGQEGILAHTRFPKEQAVGRYGIDLSMMENLAVPAIQKALDQHILIIIDEIGSMELLSPAFRQVVQKAFDSHSPILGSITHKHLPFTNALKNRPDVELIQVTLANRETLPENILAKLNS